ncbi:hypothetical protein [Streptomyces sp. NPDC058424]|uniref:hypothetical protein n=1 Tax=Streptomyces sp. NPDC058424 TaxID=3346491 RepID=UPI0036695968
MQERAAVPTELVLVDEMPLTPVGKVSKPALRDDALEREVRTLVAGVSPGGGPCEVRIDNSGPRRRVVVLLSGVSEQVVDSLKSRLGGYEFAATVRVRDC